MVTWYADGSISGFSLDANTTNVPATALPGMTRDVYRLASPGMVDVNGVTRLQYPVADASGNFRQTLDGVGRLSFTAAEVADRSPAPPSGGPNSPAIAGVSMFVTDAANFVGTNFVPTPNMILGLGDAKVQVFRSSTGLAVGNLEYIIRGPVLQPNRKYWVLITPTRYDPGSAPSTTNDRLFGNNENIGRGISVWSNRTPLAPVITSPAPDTAYQINEEFTFSFKSKDPDDAGGGNDASADDDMAGMQIQYSPRPTPANPSPAWIDLPIATLGGAAIGLGAGWYINHSTQNVPVNDANNGGFYAWVYASLTVKCGTSSLAEGKGVLPSGDWLLRVRTFDYGHAYPRWKNPLAESPLSRTPDNYPSLNISAWSEPVRVLVSAQVPAPVPLSPVQNRAVVVGQPLTLTWRYRNTVAPPLGPYPQARRKVQIREVGAADWFTLTDSASANTYYDVLPTGNATPDYQYLTNGGFESASVPDGWNADGNPSGVATFVGSVGSGTVHGGARALFTSSGSGAIVVSTILTLRATDYRFDFEGWTKLGPRTSKHTFVVVWLKANGDPVQAATLVDRPAGTGWVRQQMLDLVRPAGAVKVQIGILPTLVAGQANTTQDAFDDFSFKARVASNDYGYTVQANKHYEWRVQTSDATTSLSDWSTPARFWVVPVPASGIRLPTPGDGLKKATLGCGTHRVFIYRRGGKVRVGEVTGITHVDWGRLRDDMSDAKIVVSDWGVDCGKLLGRLEPWAYEVVILRNNGYSVDRVWEGPITLLTYDEGNKEVTIQAKDVVAYLYRRIVKQAMNDSKTGSTVTLRALRIIQNVLAPDDPNMLAYVQALTDPSDAKEYRNMPGFSRTAYEEIDDMAANAGLDYTAVGRAVLLWGTKHRIGTLPEFTGNDLGATPVVSVYGMSFANFYSVSDGAGNHGDADRLKHVVTGDEGYDPDYGLVEMLSSSWASDSPEDAGTYTQAGLATVIKSFEGYAERSIADRYPPPVVVRVPDNTTVNPDAVISIQHLVPGVVIPLRAQGMLREVVADQKLDSVKVVEENGEETIQITLSPFSKDDASMDTEGTS